MTVTPTIPAGSSPTRRSVPQPTITHDAAVELIEAVRGQPGAALARPDSPPVGD